MHNIPSPAARELARRPAAACGAVAPIDADASTLAFHRRVFDEAREARHPLLERVKFLAIVGSNVDDFLRRHRPAADVASAACQLIAAAEQYWRSEIRPRLRGAGIDVPAATALEQLWPIAAIDRPDLHDRPFTPRMPEALAGGDPFARLRDGDLLVHRPYESFDGVVALVTAAAHDPAVERIGLTLYRTDRQSAIGQALIAALARGAVVDVIVEPHARGDEANNAAWAATLERQGARVRFGVAGLKVHAKMLLIVRREDGAPVRYAHLSSGNYQAATARVYTDVSLFTRDQAVAADVERLLDLLLGCGPAQPATSLLVAPFALRDGLLRLLAREAAWARRGVPAHAILKMNALTDRQAIEAVYEASRAGVRVDLIVRGACCLRPGVAGVSTGVHVRSLVGRFLEHGRAWYWRNGGAEEAYIGSADLMPRNFDERVELMVPLRSPALVQRVRHEVLGMALADTVNARILRSDGSYGRPHGRTDAGAVDSHRSLLAQHQEAM